MRRGWTVPARLQVTAPATAAERAEPLQMAVCWAQELAQTDRTVVVACAVGVGIGCETVTADTPPFVDGDAKW